ncbi:putative cysteine protease [Lyophyllum shimeji]|uniref:Cysteine protease n=1 Tax=Lyophyllum shimeji TaxID=47721 RepID=A0A9P3PT95_LYOSH|nr:putative cysteine protease [Lyophyllum shimeji]
MSSKSPRQSPVPSQHASKLPKFLQKQSNRDRSKSVTDPAATASTSSLASPTPSEVPSSSKPRKSSKFLVMRDKDDKPRGSTDVPSPPPPPPSEHESSKVDEPPVIVEPGTVPRSRTRSERPLSSATEPPQHLSSMYSSASSTSRIGDLPSRLSGWFSHTFSTSSTDLSLPALLSQSHSTGSSPKSKGSSALLTAAKHGKGHLDKAMRYLLDSDSTPDKCTDPIWILGVQHPGYEPPTPPSALSASTSSITRASSLRSSTSSLGKSTSTLDGSSLATPSKHPNPGAHWPPVFYADFTSRVWLTYRSHFTPIRDGRLADLSEEGSDAGAAAHSPTTVRSRPWNWVGGEKGWTSDTGWGCMLRTGQSLLANALVHLHLGRDWRRPPHPVHTADYATYVQILTWFFDTPAPEAPFSVHRMALAGKELGKEVGQWFGPSTAAGAIKTLVNSFPEAGLGVAVATDGVLFQSDVFTGSHTGAPSLRSPRRHLKALSSSWGDRPVLLLIGVRLGLDGVNPIYYDTIKLLYTFPQSVGIAGGRPSSSYYFVGSQADNLFYLDPHHARPAVPLRPPPSNPQVYRETTPESDRDNTTKPRNQRSPPPTSPSSIRTGSSTFSYHAPLSPSPLQQEFSTSSSTTGSSSSSNFHNYNPRASRSPPPSIKQHHSRFRSTSASQSHSPLHSPLPSEAMDARELGFDVPGTGLDPMQEHYVTAYTAVELKTFHCERVRKMPLSGLDPSMLIGFLCKDEADWWDLRRRVGELPRMVFSVQDEPPTWPSDSDDNMGLESISEPDDLDMDMGMEEDEDGEDEDEDEGAEQFFDTRSASASTSSASGSGSAAGNKSRRGRSEEVDTEEDPVDPITPLPNARFSIDAPISGRKTADNEDRERWSLFPPLPIPPSAQPANEVKRSSGKKNSKKGKKGEVPVPVPLVKMPTPPLTRQQQQQQEHFPFPVTHRYADETSPMEPEQRNRNSSSKSNGKRMHTARARDGGRTQSGGVKGVLTDN